MSMSFYDFCLISASEYMAIFFSFQIILSTNYLLNSSINSSAKVVFTIWFPKHTVSYLHVTHINTFRCAHYHEIMYKKVLVVYCWSHVACKSPRIVKTAYLVNVFMGPQSSFCPNLRPQWWISLWLVRLQVERHTIGYTLLISAQSVGS